MYHVFFNEIAIYYTNVITFLIIYCYKIYFTAKLTEQWNTLDREYAVEEQELNLMLKTDNEKRIEKETKNLFADWESALFGINILAAEQSNKDLNSFILIRYAFNVQTYNDISKIFQ